MLRHYRLGHPTFPYLKALFPSLFKNKDSSLLHCDFCQLATQTCVLFLARIYKPSQPFSLLHSDMWGPSRVNNLSKAKWFITFIDDYSRTTWVYLLKEKSEARQTSKEFHAIVKTQFQTDIRVLHTNDGTEYFNSILRSYLSQ